MTPYEALYRGPRVFVRGYNGALATSNEMVNPASLAWAAGTNFWSTATLIKVASANAADAADGTGMRTIRVIGAGADGSVQTEDITLNGTTAVSSTKTWKMIYAVYGLTFGTGLANAGIIYIADDGATFTSGNPATPEEALIIPVGENAAFAANFIVPAGLSYKVKTLKVGVSTQPVVLSVYVYNATAGAWSGPVTIPVGNVGFWTVECPLGISLDAGDGIRIDALSTTAAGRVFVELELEA